MKTIKDVLIKVKDAELRQKQNFKIELKKSDYSNARRVIEVVRSYCRADVKSYNLYTTSHNGKITLYFSKR